MECWEEKLLGEVLTLSRGFDLPQKDRRKGDVPIVSSSGMTGFHDEARAFGPGVVTGRYGTLGEVFFIKGDYWPLNTTLYVRDFKGNDPWFVYYLLKSLDFSSYNDKSSVPGLNRNHLHQIRLQVPGSVSEQRAIAHVLGTLDDKIELNRRMNRTLEETARALFRSWFVDFDPVRAKAAGRQPEGMDAATAALFPSLLVALELGEIPEGWTMAPLRSLVTLSKRTLNPAEFPDEAFDHFSIPAFDNGQIPNVELGQTIRSNKFLVPEGAILLSKLNPRLPRVWLPVPGPKRRAISSTEFLVSIPFRPCEKAFAYSVLTSDQFTVQFASMVTGTSGSHQRVKPEYLLAMEFICPPTELVERFGMIVQPIMNRIKADRIEGEKLTAMREALLPRLLNGALGVDQLIQRGTLG